MTLDEAAAAVEQFKRDVKAKMAELRAVQDRTGYPRDFELERRAIRFYEEADRAADGLRLVAALVGDIDAVTLLAGDSGLI